MTDKQLEDIRDFSERRARAEAMCGAFSGYKEMKLCADVAKFALDLKRAVCVYIDAKPGGASAKAYNRMSKLVGR